ncbi:MAG: zinc ribbon domain-containing protein [Roseburia sp.]|nr:zinc ribbon domain-containing protein [Roseburia sp.]
MFCFKCGEQIPNESVFCIKCGVKQIKESSSCKKENNGDSVKFELYGRKIEYNSRYDKIFEVFRKITEKAEERYDEFEDMYESKIHSFNSIYNVLLPYLVEEIKIGIDYAISLLVEYGVDYITAEEFVDVLQDDDGEEYEDSITEIVKEFYLKADNLQREVDKISKTRDVQRASRSYWSGGGFGIRGALTGVAKASAMNAANGIVRGIGDTIINVADRNKINKLKDKIYDECCLDYFAYNIVYFYNSEIFSSLWDVFEEEGVWGEIDAHTDREDARLENYKKMYQKNKTTQNYEKLINAYIDCIQKDPFSVEYYSDLYSYVKQDKNKIMEIVDFVGLREEYIRQIIVHDNERIDLIMRLKENTISDIERKIELLEQIEIDNPDIEIDELEELKNKLRSML